MTSVNTLKFRAMLLLLEVVIEHLLFKDMILQIGTERLVFYQPPDVPKEPYQHPFFHFSGGLCFGSVGLTGVALCE